KLRFVKTMSLAKQAITLQDDDENDYELESFLRNYIEKKKLECERQTQQRELQILKKYQNFDVPSIQINNEKLVSIENVADPAYYVGKEAPRKKRIKGEQENYQ
ncbi:6976_t:CDS:1, partial [Scutellospora calospora]